MQKTGWTIRISKKSGKEGLPICRETHRHDFYGGVLFDIRFKLVHEDGELGIIKPSIMSAEISYISNAFDPALEICISGSVCTGYRLFVLVFPAFEKFRQRAEAEKLTSAYIGILPST